MYSKPHKNGTAGVVLRASKQQNAVTAFVNKQNLKFYEQSTTQLLQNIKSCQSKAQTIN